MKPFWLRAWVVASTALLAACAPSAAPPALPPAKPQRIVSLDYCADQFVLKLADREQIAALSPEATLPISYMRAEVGDLRQVPPRAEEVLVLQPDLIVRAYGGGANAGAYFARAGARVVQVGHAENFEGVRANIRVMAQAFGHPARGEALVRAFDQRLAWGASVAERPSALYLAAGGVTTGPGGLIDELIRTAGFDNFETEPGWRTLPLERLAQISPDVTAAAFFGARGQDQDAWSAARHPIARRLLTQRPAVQLEGAWVSCGGWFVADAVEALRAHADAPDADE
jgi:iron complex transport system substrate-binding protein